MIEGPGVWWRFHEDDVTRQQVRPGTARRIWPYLRRYRGPILLLVLITVVDAAIVAVGGGQDDDHAPWCRTLLETAKANPAASAKRS